MGYHSRGGIWPRETIVLCSTICETFDAHTIPSLKTTHTIETKGLSLECPDALACCEIPPERNPNLFANRC